MLDTSGSIGPANFKRITTVLSKFVPLICGDIQVAILSYSDELHVEFCFDCYNLAHNNIGRLDVGSAIKNIQYRGGNTHTGLASRCVRDYILNPDTICGRGINISSECLDIIYVTDGMSNGPLKYPETCTEATCLKNHLDWCGRVNTYAIAIGSVNQNEIDCLTQNNGTSVFNVDDFEGFEKLVNESESLLKMKPESYECVKLDENKCAMTEFSLAMF